MADAFALLEESKPKVKTLTSFSASIGQERDWLGSKKRRSRLKGMALTIIALFRLSLHSFKPFQLPPYILIKPHAPSSTPMQLHT